MQHRLYHTAALLIVIHAPGPSKSVAAGLTLHRPPGRLLSGLPGSHCSQRQCAQSLPCHPLPAASAQGWPHPRSQSSFPKLLKRQTLVCALGARLRPPAQRASILTFVLTAHQASTALANLSHAHLTLQPSAHAVLISLP